MDNNKIIEILGKYSNRRKDDLQMANSSPTGSVEAITRAGKDIEEIKEAINFLQKNNA